jgi:hypothetical protein
MEVRDEIRKQALWHDPAIIHHDNYHLREMNGNAVKTSTDMVMIPKRRYPEVIQLCCEARRFAFRIKALEGIRESRHGTPAYCRAGRINRPFDPTIDIYWLRKEDLPIRECRPAYLRTAVESVQRLAIDVTSTTTPVCRTLTRASSSPTGPRMSRLRIRLSRASLHI